MMPKDNMIYMSWNDRCNRVIKFWTYGLMVGLWLALDPVSVLGLENPEKRFQELVQRGRLFEELGLFFVAQEQYGFLDKTFTGRTEVEAALERLSRLESKRKKVQRTIEKEKQRQTDLEKLVSRDYLYGVEHYQKNDLEGALAYFVKVVNMHPQHKGALTYIEKIGQKLNEKMER